MNLLAIYIVGVGRSLSISLLLDVVIVNVHSYGFVTIFMHCAPETTKFGKITQNKGHFDVPGHSRSVTLVPIKAHIRLPIKMIARQVLCIKFMNLLLATKFPPCSYRIFIPSASRGPSADVYY